ncbi:MAG: RluA family pseudouridine synthase [Actinomycetia bacterium]|nr:RluA family pseudouridine synthase [Actinomycetes bacterium]
MSAPPKHNTYIVDDEFVGMRLDAFVATCDGVVSRSAAAKLIEGDDVLVNGRSYPKRYMVKSGDEVTVDIPPSPSSELIAQDIPLDIRYEDDELIVLSKQAGLVVHPAQGHWSGTLVNALLAHQKEWGTKQGEDRLGIVHRLDKDTSGLMLVAKTDEAQVKLQNQIRLRETDRRYLCLVHGWIAPDSGTIDAPIGRDHRDRLLMRVTDTKSSRGAITTFQVLERFDAGRFDNGYTLVACKLFTGRTHQIRVHMDYIHHPVVGDQVYGRGNDRANRDLKRQFLHSYYLSFTHPTTGDRMEFFDALPADLAAVCEQIEVDSAGLTEAGTQVRALL